jgi:hypothetical protein
MTPEDLLKRLRPEVKEKLNAQPDEPVEKLVERLTTTETTGRDAWFGDIILTDEGPIEVVNVVTHDRVFLYDYLGCSRPFEHDGPVRILGRLQLTSEVAHPAEW